MYVEHHYAHTHTHTQYKFWIDLNPQLWYNTNKSSHKTKNKNQTKIKKKRAQCALDTTLRKQTQITFISFPLRRIEFIFQSLRWNCLLSYNVLSKTKLKRHSILFSKNFLKKPPHLVLKYSVTSVHMMIRCWFCH